MDGSQRKSLQAKLPPMVKRILREYKYPLDAQEAAVNPAVNPALQQAKALAEVRA